MSNYKLSDKDVRALYTIAEDQKAIQSLNKQLKDLCDVVHVKKAEIINKYIRSSAVSISLERDHMLYVRPHSQKAYQKFMIDNGIEPHRFLDLDDKSFIIFDHNHARLNLGHEVTHNKTNDPRPLTAIGKVIKKLKLKVSVTTMQREFESSIAFYKTKLDELKLVKKITSK